MFVNRINVVRSRYLTKARHLASWPNRIRSVQNQNFLKWAIANKSSRIHVICYDAICFRPAKKTHSSVRWDCILFSVDFSQSENRVQRNPKISPVKTTKEATEESKHNVKDRHENEALSSWKNPEGRPVITKNRDFSRLRNKIRMRSLVPLERN